MSIDLQLRHDDPSEPQTDREDTPVLTGKEVERALRLSTIFLFVGLFGLIFACRVYQPLDLSPAYTAGLILFGAPLSFYLISVIRKQVVEQVTTVRLLFSWSAILLVVAAVFYIANGALDNAPQQPITTTVMRSYISRSRRSTSYHLVVQSWRPGRTEENLTVGSSTYRRCGSGRQVRVELHPGFIGITWYGRVTPL